MSKYCPTAKRETNCTDNCKDCARAIYHDLKAKLSKADYVSEQGIKSRIGEEEFNLLREYGFIEYCTTIQEQKMYAI